MIFKFNKRLMIFALAGVLTSVTGVAWCNGNTTADAPAPQTQSSTRIVKKAPIKKAPVKKTTTKTTVKTTAKAPVKKESSLEKGIALAQQERYQAALPWLQKAVQENPKSASAWYWYGKCHEQTGQFHQAQYFYTRAVDIDPTFDPLSRVVVYPDDPLDKTPVWDPKRPARVYPVATQQKDGTYVVPPDAPGAVQKNLPSRPARDPELPSVPSYTPPQPGKLGESGPDQSWQPAIYVPPSRISTIDEGDETATYMPPGAPRIAKENINPVQPIQAPVQVQAHDLSGFQNLLPASPAYQPPVLDAGSVSNAKPQNTQAYQPPEPPKTATKPATKPATQVKKAAPAKKPAVPRKIVTKKTSTSKSTSTSTSKTTTQQPDQNEPKLPVIPQPESPIVTQPEPVQQPAQKQAQPKPVKQEQPKQPEPVKQEQPAQSQPEPARPQREEYMPPVGQGSRSNNNSGAMPPVQGQS